jgi:hypothetical protein
MSRQLCVASVKRSGNWGHLSSGLVGCQEYREPTDAISRWVGKVPVNETHTGIFPINIDTIPTFLKVGSDVGN